MTAAMLPETNGDCRFMRMAAPDFWGRCRADANRVGGRDVSGRAVPHAGWSRIPARSRPDQAAVEREDHRLDPVAQRQLAEDAVDVRLHGAEPQIQPVGDLLVRQAM